MRKAGWEMEDQTGTKSSKLCEKFSHYPYSAARKREDLAARGGQRWDSNQAGWLPSLSLKLPLRT